jgi:diacylglycerol kinase (ATP)
MATVAVVAHAGKSFGGGLPELRQVLASEGITDPLWYEVAKSRKAPKRARQALERGADVIFVWGGDGTVQRCIDAVAGTDAVLAILPAGTANLLATNLGVPTDMAQAVQAGLHGRRCAVMAGAGFDASMIKEADGALKDRLGRAAYIYTGALSLDARRTKATIKVDGKPFFKGRVSCVLIGNVSKLLGGIEAFPGARPDDGMLELGVVTAKGPVQWARTLGRLALGSQEKSPFVRMTSGTRFVLRFERRIRYELDGGARPAVRKIRVRVHPASITICRPA